MLETIQKLLFVSRPISWVNTAYPFAFAWLLLGGPIDAFFILTTFFFLIPYNLIMYGINDVYDYESDMKNPRKNSIEGALESKQFHPTILRACTYCLLFIPFMIYLQPTIPFVVWLAISLFFVVAYSIKGLRFKEKAFLDSITSSLHFTLPLVVAIAALHAPVVPLLPYIGILFCWGMASHAFGAVQDIIPDRKGNLSSIATSIGARATVWLCIALYIGASAMTLLALPNALGGIISVMLATYIANIAPYTQITDETSATTNVAWRRFIWLNYISGAVITMSTLWFIA